MMKTMKKMRSARLGLYLLLILTAASCGFPRLSDLIDGGGSEDSPDATSVQEFPSCHQLLANCGSSGTDDCCSALPVVGGTFYRNHDAVGDSLSSGSKLFPARVSSFRLDKYETTVGRFRAFLNAGMGTQSNPPAAGSGAHANIPNSGWNEQWNAEFTTYQNALALALKCNQDYQTWTDMPETNENRPINCVTWYEAMAFCIWDGGYLPTDLEWNYTASGGDQQRAYPWSSPAGELMIDSSYASYSDGTDCVGDGAAGCALTDLLPVGA